MTDRVPVERTTRQLIEDGRARQEALANVDTILASVQGTAYDNYGSVRVTVDGRGKLVELWLRQDAVRWGPEQLGSLIVAVADAALAQATQAGYNKLGPILGDSMTQAIEMLSGRAAPARTGSGPGITAEEFQRRRDERMHAQWDRSPAGGPSTGDGGGPAGQDAPGAGTIGGQAHPAAGAAPAGGTASAAARAGDGRGGDAADDGFDPDDPLSFDLSSLRSDR
ncbi:YbaB/EbfC family nucleoid-associated protein [Actinokineospora terrae]|uniref:YbaB/EbfC DNA-binding family protein n=1 Tax=Actinokineospora terrae TaxID=155974 RepID=A0A1H9S8U0_9PSEU|nr:YbaB/EbfC family nucleoid-associated protein [Actinokineospora terrae]SER81420.1 YbaB/EbfC DNA-binding family protein [Actinokineospora terrae]